MIALLVVILAGALACKSDPGAGDKASTDEAEKIPQVFDPKLPLRVGEVSMRHAPILENAVAPPEDKVASRFTSALLGQPEFVPLDREGHGPFTAKGVFRSGKEGMRDASGQVIGSVYVSVTLEQTNATPPLGRDYRAEALVGEALVGEEQAALDKLLLSVVDECAINIAKQVRVDKATDAELVAMLGKNEADPELLGFVLDAVRDRPVGGASKALVPLLKHRERDIVNRTAAALAVVGEEAAVPALIEAGSRVSTVDRLPVLYALGEIGGPQAALYLKTLTESGAELRVLTAAQQALERAQRKKP